MDQFLPPYPRNFTWSTNPTLQQLCNSPGAFCDRYHIL